MISIKPCITDLKDYQRGELPEGAIKLEMSSSIEEHQKKAAPIAMILCIVVMAAMLIKTISNHAKVVSIPSIAIGCIAGLALIFVHELLHAVAYPREATVTIGMLKGKLVAVALASYPLSQLRFITMCLLPFTLGVIPLLIFALSPAESHVSNGIMFGLASVGMVSPFPDVYNVIAVLKQSHENDRIMFYEDDLYRIPGNTAAIKER